MVALQLQIGLARRQLAERIRSHPLDLSGQFGSGEGELTTHGRGQVDHLDAPTFQTDLV